MSADGGPAFPGPNQIGTSADGGPMYSDPFCGMSLRDYFAAKALPLGWEIEKERPTGPYSEHMEPTFAGAATRAYYLADAMLKARERK